VCDGRIGEQLAFRLPVMPLSLPPRRDPVAEAEGGGQGRPGSASTTAGTDTTYSLAGYDADGGHGGGGGVETDVASLMEQ
jgi:hypothetical protein